MSHTFNHSTTKEVELEWIGLNIWAYASEVEEQVVDWQHSLFAQSQAPTASTAAGFVTLFAHCIRFVSCRLYHR